LLQALVANDGGGNGTPPFRHERVITPTATLACALVPSTSGSPEKRFAILPGKSTVEELREKLLESRDFLAPEQYSRALEKAGVTRSLLGVLAIEQGKMNSLSERKPRELFSDVLEMLGDRAVLERYRQARRRYEDTQTEVGNQMSELQNLQFELARLQREVQTLEEWEAARDKVSRLEGHLPAARYQETWKRREGAAPKLNELRTKVRNNEAEQKRLEVRVKEAEVAAEEKEHKKAHAIEIEEEAFQAMQETVAAHAASKERVARLEEIERKLSALPEEDLTILEAAFRTAYEKEIEAGQAVRDRSSRANEIRARVKQLRAGLPVFPSSVTETLEALGGEGIEAVLLATLLRPTDRSLAEAVEAALGDARYGLLVSEEQAARATEVARTHDFPGPVTSGPRFPGPMSFKGIEMKEGGPVWLAAWAQGVGLNANGTWRDERGHWVRRPAQRVLGAEAIEAELRAAEDELRKTEASLAESQEEVRRRAEERETAEARVKMEGERLLLLAERTTLATAREDRDIDAGREKAAVQALKNARKAQRDAAEKEMQAKRELDRVQDELAKLTLQLNGERDALEASEKDVLEADEALRVMEPTIAPELLELARNGALDATSTIQGDLNRAKESLLKLGEPPRPEVREEHRHLRANVEEAENHLEARREEASQAQAELAECRRRYLEVVEGALQDYRRRAIELGRPADVIVEMETPRLEEDDRVLDEAGIHSRFGFDGKDPVPLGDSSFSGGQQVVCGLILLMAMAETEGEGFFLLDEPFAHLSLDRVDDVGRFLRSTRSQFLLTAPTTLDRAQLDPASMVIVMRKKRPGEEHAPVPLVAVS
jgi:DNA repair exonuclease SbcCD ATPase subunit